MNRKYKKSQFNYESNTQRGHLIYNTLYNSLTRLSDEEYQIYISLSETEENALIVNQLLMQGLWVETEVDELEQYNLYTYYANRYITNKQHLTITPTMECNARCFYCYEDGVRCGKMHKEQCKDIIEFLKKFDCSSGIDLTWFGGEPLMNQEWMDCFSESLEEAGIEYTAFIITNGSKINDSVIEKMISKWKIQDVQITLDGSFDEYASRKSYVDQDNNVYYKILQTIGKLAKNGISVQIRMNIDRTNRESILAAVEDIAELFNDNSRVKCYPAFLTGTSNPLSENEKIDFIKNMVEVSRGTFNVNECLYRLPRTKACYYNQKNAISIDINGNVFVCEHMLGHEQQAIGNIKSEVILDEREQSGQRKECQRCVFLPKCQGGCIDSLKNGEVPCFTDKYIIKAYLDLL